MQRINKEALILEVNIREVASSWIRASPRTTFKE
jgi:hypothetical protein